METTVSQCLSVPAAAKAAGVSQWLAWKHIRLGKLRARKLGRRTIITAEDFHAWLEAAERLPPAVTDVAVAPPPRTSRFAKVARR